MLDLFSVGKGGTCSVEILWCLKDKVFPVKARRIAELRQQLDSLTVSQKVKFHISINSMKIKWDVANEVVMTKTWLLPYLLSNHFHHSEKIHDSKDSNFTIAMRKRQSVMM